MKVVTPQEMSRIEHLAYEEGASEEAFMDQAGRSIRDHVERFIETHSLPRHAILFCGKGNNGGDAYVVGVELLKNNFEVIAFQLHPIEQCSPLCQKKHRQFLEKGGRVKEVQSVGDLDLPNETLLIDGLFGTGFRGQLEEPYASVIEAVNLSRLPIVAVDIPSGLNGETGKVESVAIRATETVFLGLPKTGFFLGDGVNHCGVLRYGDFGLPSLFIDQARADMILLTTDRVRSFLPQISRNRHKYAAGHVIALAGSPGMPGAAILSATASLRGGAGIIHLLHPEGMEAELAAMPPEVIRISYSQEEREKIRDQLNRATACYIGPGLGRTPETAEFLRWLFPQISQPVVIDADALSLIPEYDLPIPQKAVLTPHTGEMHRLLLREKKSPVDPDFLTECREYAERHQIALVLKGSASFIFFPDEPILVNATSDPGMATAGSGDVLTGLIAALLAQKLSPHQAAALGVHLHGLAGVYAAEEKTSYSMIASDLIAHLPQAFRIKKW